MYSVSSHWSDRIKVVEKPLFPGYIFARFEPWRLASLLTLPGILSVLDSNLRPSPLLDTEVQNVALLAASLAPLTPSLLVAGDAVTIRHGAFKGVRGVIKRHAGALRLVVNVEMLRRSVSVEIAAADLERA